MTVHETRERYTADVSVLIAAARNPLRLVHGAHKASGAEPREAAPWPLLHALLRHIRRAFLRAGTPTSVPESGTGTSATGHARVAGSLLRRMD